MAPRVGPRRPVSTARPVAASSNGRRPDGRRITVLGSTGSIGRSTLAVAARLPGYRVVGLAAGRDVETVCRQAKACGARYVALADEAAAREARRRLGRSVEVLAGPEGVVEAASRPDADVVVSAIVGSAGLAPTLAAVRRGARVAIANKETLVAGGELVTREAERSGAVLVPVDSEHSAIFQCLAGQEPGAARRLVLTASGGPFRKRTSLERVTVREALRHPTWRMGRKITIDSATLMNKGLEIIEARWLFGIPVERIEVLIHPQSIVHSLVELRDGSVLAQLGWPDMKLPIQVALAWPSRGPATGPWLDLARARTLSFEPPDPKRFPCLARAREAAEAGGAAPVVLNAANEVAVQAFLERRIPFTGIPAVIEAALAAFKPRGPKTLEEILAVDREARAVAAGLAAMVA
jgi:1-deoxy-D-xylulose-5-phosphate reductoisomerase